MNTANYVVYLFVIFYYTKDEDKLKKNPYVVKNLVFGSLIQWNEFLSVNRSYIIPSLFIICCATDVYKRQVIHTE